MLTIAQKKQNYSYCTT